MSFTRDPKDRGFDLHELLNKTGKIPDTQSIPTPPREPGNSPAAQQREDASESAGPRTDGPSDSVKV
jgi:hypothetical protein